MTTENSIACPHCSAPNIAGSAFCESCGMALPTTSAGPRLVSADANPSSAAGAKLVSAELVKQTKTAANALLIVAIIQLVVGSILAVVAANVRGRTRVGMGAILVSFVCIGLIFLGLYFWARRSPLPATIVGLVVYGTLVAINIIVAIGSIAKNQNGTPGGLGIGWLDIVIIIILVRGIGAAMKQRRMTVPQ